MKKKVLIGIIVGLIVICLVVGVILLITLNNKTDDTNLPIDNSYFDELKPSEGLEMTLIDDERSYAVSGIGTCTDTEIVIPKTTSATQ